MSPSTNVNSLRASRPGQVPLFDVARIERIEVVEAGDAVAARAQPLGEVRADEPGRAGQQDPHAA